MKKLIRLLGVFLVVCLLIGIGGYVYVAFYGKDVLETQLEQALQRKVVIRRCTLALPLTLHLENIRSGKIRIEQVYASINPWLLLNKEFVVDTLRIIGPNVPIKKDPQGLFIDDMRISSQPQQSVPVVLPEQQILVTNSTVTSHLTVREPSEKENGGTRYDLAVRINVLRIENGEIEFQDTTADPLFSMKLIHLGATVKDINPDFARDMTIMLAADMSSADVVVKDALRLEGKINLKSKDVKLTLKLDGIDYNYFKQYYPAFGKPEKLGIEKAVLLLVSSVYTQEEKLVIESAVSLKDLKFQEKEKSEKYQKISELITSVVNAFKTDAQVYPTFKFKMSTDINNPQVNFDDIRRQFKSQAHLSIDLRSRVVSGMASSVKRVINGFQAVPQGLMRIFHGNGPGREVIR